MQKGLIGEGEGGQDPREDVDGLTWIYHSELNILVSILRLIFFFRYFFRYLFLDSLGDIKFTQPIFIKPVVKFSYIPDCTILLKLQSSHLENNNEGLKEVRLLDKRLKSTWEEIFYAEFSETKYREKSNCFLWHA